MATSTTAKALLTAYLKNIYNPEAVLDLLSYRKLSQERFRFPSPAEMGQLTFLERTAAGVTIWASERYLATVLGDSLIGSATFDEPRSGKA